MKPIAVIILNWNGEKLLREFLPSVCRYTPENIADIIVADNGSTDASVPLLKEKFPRVRLLELGKNHGFAEGYNRAIGSLDYPYVVLLNSDVEVSENWLPPLYEYCETHTDVAACQPKIRSYRNKEYFEYAGASGGYLDKYGFPFCRGRIFNTIEKDNGQYDNNTDIFWATGACLFIRTEIYKKAGGLDKEFFAHMEEIDLCWRLRSRGKSIVCIPQSVVYHVGAATLKKESPRKTYLNFRNNLVMLYKNLPPQELNKVMRVRAFLDYLAALQYLLKGQLDNVKAVFHARSEYKRLRSYFLKAREENLRKTYVDSIPERIKSSILWQFYVKGRKRFSQLSDFKG